jgi:hypothetical protein
MIPDPIYVDADEDGDTSPTIVHGAMRITFYVGKHDGVPVVQIDTDEDTSSIRVNVNDAPVFDGRTDDSASAGRGWKA